MNKVYQLTISTSAGNSFTKYVEAKNIKDAFGKSTAVVKKEQAGYSNKLELDAVEFVCNIER